jgi:hypothetical protein
MTTAASVPPTIFNNFLIVLFIAIVVAAKLGIYFLSTKYSANFFVNYLHDSGFYSIFAP